LNFIDDDQAAQFLERGHGLGETLRVAWIFQVESFTALGRLEQLTGQRSFARLSWAEQCNYRTGAKERSNAGGEILSRKGFHYLENLEAYV